MLYYPESALSSLNLGSKQLTLFEADRHDHQVSQSLNLVGGQLTLFTDIAFDGSVLFLELADGFLHGEVAIIMEAAVV